MMMPCALRTCLQWLMVIVTGKLSPGSTPARNTSVLAVIVLSGAEVAVLRVSLFRTPMLEELGSLPIWKL